VVQLKDIIFWAGVSVIAIALIALFILYASCNFSLESDESCPTPTPSVWIGTFLGALTISFFFFFIERRVRSTLEGLGHPKGATSRWIIIWALAFVIGITLLSYIVSSGFCNLNSDCPTPLWSVWLGAVFGAVATALFFIMINIHVSSALEELGKLYVARTCVLNLIDIFGKKDGEGRIKKDEHNRQLFLTRLDKLYIKEYKVRGELINTIHDKAKEHEPIVSDHDHTACDDCKDIMGLIKQFNSSFVNSVEKDAHKRDWMGP
jgi:hypothetical protein